MTSVNVTAPITKVTVNGSTSVVTATTAGPQGPEIDFALLDQYSSPVNGDQLAIFDAAASDIKKVSLEDLIAKRARDSRRIYLSKDTKANDSNNGTSPEEPLLTFAAAIAAAEPGDVIEVSPGTYTEASLPLRVPRDVGIFAKSLRQVKIQPAAGQEMNGFFKVDSGFWVWGLEFAGHQADLANNQQSWAISFDDQADNTAAPLNASGLGAFILKSPYVQNCSSVTAEDDAGTAGSVSVGDTGGGIEVDGDKCAANSPIRSMVVDSYTQVNLGGPGCSVKNDGYAQLVSFFGTFCTFHVKSETGGQANLSGGGTTDFGDQGLVADGYSRLPNFTGSARVAAYGADRAEAPVVIDPSLDTFTTISAHTLVANDQVTFSATDGALPTGVTVGTTYYVIASGLAATVFKVSATEGGSSIDITGSATGTYQFVRQGQLTADVISFTANRIGSKSRPNPGQLMFPRQTFPSAGQPGSAGNAVGVTAGVGSNFMVILNSFSYSHEYVSGGTVTVGGTSYNIATASYDHTTGITTLTATGYTPTTGDSAVLSGLDFICPTHGVYTITGSVPIDASGNVVAVDSPSLAGYRLNFYNTINGGLRSPIAASQVIDFRLRSQISCALHTMEYVGSGTNYNALPWNGGVPIAANQRVELNNGRVFGATINEKGDFEIGDGTFSIDGTTGSATINTSEFNISGLNFVGPFSRNGGFSTVGVQLREVSDNTSLIASTGTSDGNTVPTQNAVKDYVDTTTVQSVDLSAPTGFTSAGGPITTSGTITLGYDTGYQGYLTTESTKLAGVEAGAQVNVSTNLGYASNTRIISSSTGTDATLPLAVAAGDAGLLTGADKTQLDNLSTNLAGKANLSGGKLVTSELPDLAITEFKGVVASQAAMLAISGEKGDWVTRSDDGKVYLITGDDPTQIGSWTALSYPASPVLSVNTQTGTVVLDADNISDAATTNKFTTAAEATKLAGIEAGAQVNVATNLTYTASTRTVASSTGTDAVIAEVVAAGNSGLMTGADKSKLDGVAAGAEVNVNADWNATTGDAFIENKPTIPSGDLVDDTTPQLGGDLDLNGHDIVTTSNGDIDLDPNGSGVVVAKGNATRGSGQIKLNCEQNSHGIVIKGPPHSAAASYTLTLPNDDGAASDFLQTDGSGNLTWAAGGGSSYTDSDVDTHLNTSTASSNEVLSWTGSDYDWVAQSGGSGVGANQADYGLVTNSVSSTADYGVLS